MPTHAQLREKLEEMSKMHGPAVSNIAKVKSVDEVKATCVLEDEDGQELLNVRLRPVLNGKKAVMLLPKIGSSVLAVRIEDDDDWMVVGVDEVSKVGYYVGNTIVELTDKVHIEANSESLGTLMDDLFTAISNMVFVTPAGNTISLVNLTEFTMLKTRFKQLLK